MKRNMKQKGRDLLSLALCAAMLLSMMAFPAAAQEMTEQNQEEASSTNLEAITTEGAMNSGTSAETSITAGEITESEINATTDPTYTLNTPLLNNAYYGTAITSDYKDLLSDPLSDGCVYSFVNAGSGMYATSTLSTIVSGYIFNIFQVADNTSSAQAFRLEASGEGYYRIHALELDQSATRYVCTLRINLQDDNGNYIPNGKSNVSYFGYSEYSAADYMFDWRFEKVEGREDAYRIFLGETNYVMTAVDNLVGYHGYSSTSGSGSKGNIIVAPLNVMNERQIWHLESGGQRMYYGINLRETFTTATNGIHAEISSGTVNTPYFSYPVTEYGNVTSFTSSTAVCTIDDNGMLSIVKDTGGTYIRGIEHDSSGALQYYNNMLCYVYLPRGMYYLTTLDETIIFEHSDDPMPNYSYYLINYASHNGQEPTDEDQLFELVYLGHGEYCIIPQSHPTFLWYNAGGVLASIEANLSDDFSQIASSYRWNISCNNDGYMLYIGSSSYILTGSSSPSVGGIPSLSAYSSTSTNQRWLLKKANFLSGYEVPYNPELWSSNYPELWDATQMHEAWTYFDETELCIQDYTNCYNYALNLASYISQFIDYTDEYKNIYGIDKTVYAYHWYRLQPGIFGLGSNEFNPLYITTSTEYSEFQFYNISTINSIELLVDAVEADSNIAGFTFEPIGQHDVCPEGTYKVALIYGNSDYHWYRQNPDGTWSHKPGSTEVTNLDAEGKVIFDPVYAQHLDIYTHFYGYFAVSIPNVDGAYSLFTEVLS